MIITQEIEPVLYHKYSGGQKFLQIVSVNDYDRGDNLLTAPQLLFQSHSLAVNSGDDVQNAESRGHVN